MSGVVPGAVVVSLTEDVPAVVATPDATTSTKGKAVLLGGTADAPTVPYTSVTGAPTSLPPSGGAGGVLSGSFPNPGFAVDMASQAELDAAKARALALSLIFGGANG